MTPQEQPDSQAVNWDAELSKPQSGRDFIGPKHEWQDSQAEDELDEIFRPFLSDYPEFSSEVEQMKAAVRDYAERLATKRAIEELSKVEPAAYVDEGYTMVKDRIKELSATLTKEAE